MTPALLQAREGGSPPPAVEASRGPLRVVALGGGTGLPVLLRGLKRALRLAQLTAIVTAADDGGSSGRLRAAYHVLPPGDLRNCLLALSEASPTLTGLFEFRFNGHVDSGVNGHSLGNLILTAWSHLERGIMGALDLAHELLAVRGRVLPATIDDVRLVAEFADGSRIEGESRIASAGRPIRRVSLLPDTAAALPEACRAIATADLVVLAPGSLYTSLIPVLLVRDVASAIGRSPARVVLVMNLMTEPGETDGYGAAEFVRAIRLHAPDVRIDDVLLNTAPSAHDSATRYAAEGALPVAWRRESIAALGCRPVDRDLLAAGPLIRHDHDKLARAIVDLAAEVRA